MFRFCLFAAVISLVSLGGSAAARGEVKTWDGKHSIEKIEVTAVYFVPRDRQPLADWKERLDYYCRRLEAFHAREFQGQSSLKTIVRPEPHRSARTTEQLRSGDADFIYFQTLEEVDAALQFAQGEREAFPILLVFSDINWRPLDDFWRVRPRDDGQWEFEGNYSGQRHFPGAASGGARAAYLADRGVGWGLVSGDGWRVPYSGSDCVAYHEGVGHTVGLPHPEPGNPSVMSLGQYHGWLGESWLDDAQKERLGWKAAEGDDAKPKRDDLFSKFQALPEPLVPKPNEPVALQFTWPSDAKVKSLRVRVQTDLWGPWLEIPPPSDVARAPEQVSLGKFDRPTPVSYRVEAALESGDDVELWGYFQVREKPDAACLPPLAATTEMPRLVEQAILPPPGRATAIDLLALVDVKQDHVAGDWTLEDGRLTSPRQYGARIELPYAPPEEYELTIIAEPLDEPNGLILGNICGGQRFLALTSYDIGGEPASALENVAGKNVGANATTVRRAIFQKNRPSCLVCTVRKDSVTVTCDGHPLLEWQGDPQELSLSDYWKTPHENVLFLGAYNCRYRFSRVTLVPLSGPGKPLR
jgi:hypothetical protein